jgi:AcrR family transcriptional regulator
MVDELKESPQRRGREKTRERLLDAANSVLARSGFDRATVDDIAREAGFSKGAFYVHFESKDDLFWALLEGRITRQLEAFRGNVDYSKPLTHSVRTILRALFGLVREDPLWAPLYLEFGAHAARNEEVRRRLATMYEHWRHIIVGILSASRDAGRMRQDADLQFMATILVAAVEGSIVQSHLAPEIVDLEEMVEPLTDTLSEWLAPEQVRGLS